MTEDGLIRDLVKVGEALANNPDHNAPPSMSMVIQRAINALSTAPAPDELEVVAWLHPNLGWAHAAYSQVLMHCPMDGEGPVALVRESQARAKDEQRLDHIKKLERRIHNQRRSNRDTWEIVEARNNWLGSPRSRQAYARLLASFRNACTRLETSETQVKRLTEENEALRKDRDSYKGMVIGRERLHAANLGVDLDDAAVRTAVKFLKQLRAAEADRDALRKALSEIRELNMSSEDENGHRWANSDLIEQTIVFAMAGARKAMESGE